MWPDLLTFARHRGGKVEFSTAASLTLLGNRQSGARSAESGGLLLGRLVEGTADVVVDEATEPTTYDRRRRFFFRRARAGAQKLVDMAWKQSSGTRNYLGEWHTHPEQDPHPSSHDVTEWMRVSREAVYEQDALLFVIVGIEMVGVWEIVKATRAVARLDRLDRSGH
jgi:integrative and conjugative element protein (TIGR02256 family)